MSSENSVKMAMGRTSRKSAGLEFELFAANPLELGANMAGPVVREATACGALLEDIIRQFWGLLTDVCFFSISEQPHYYWCNDDFYVSQLQLAPAKESVEPPMAFLRFSDTGCDVLLEKVLGVRESAPVFDFRRISPLEASILNEFSRDVLMALHKKLLKKVDANVVSGQMTHLLWAMRVHGSPPNQRIGKIVLSLPVEALALTEECASLPLASQEVAAVEVPDSFFFHVKVRVVIYLGSGRMSLTDLNHLEIDDIVVLEQSRTDRMFLLLPGSDERLPFSTNPAEIQDNVVFHLPYTQEPSSMELSSQQQRGSARQRLWDNLMIDVSAEFMPIKLPLKHLKQMSEGLVVEMGDLLHNKVCLQVEGKTLAWGELVIVGERFAVRIREVTSETEEEETSASSIYPVATASEEENEDEDASMVSGDESVSGVSAASDDEDNVDEFLDDDFDEPFDENNPGEFS